MTTTAPRRELLLSAAAGLFASHGFHAVGIDDIGTAAGISGPGVYRHFAGKQALLEDLCDLAMRTLERGAEAVRHEHPRDPSGALHALVEQHVEFAVRERDLIAVYYREQRALPDEVRHDQRRRQRAYEAVWRDTAEPLRTDLSRPEVSLVVVGALAVLNVTALSATSVPPARLSALMRRTAMATLLGR